MTRRADLRVGIDAGEGRAVRRLEVVPAERDARVAPAREQGGLER